MTFAEIIVFCIFVLVMYRTLGPAQKRLESWLYRRLKSRKPGSQKPVIEIKDFKRRN